MTSTKQGTNKIQKYPNASSLKNLTVKANMVTKQGDKLGIICLGRLNYYYNQIFLTFQSMYIYIRQSKDYIVTELSTTILID